MTPRLIAMNPGDTLFQEGDPSKKIFIVKEGHLMVFRQREDLEIPLEILKTGDLIGSVSIFTSEPRSASVKALSHVLLECYDEIDPLVFLATVPSWVLAVFKDVATRLKRMDQLIIEARKNEKALKQLEANEFTYATMLCRLLKALVEARAGGEVLQVNFSIEGFVAKAASILQIKEEILNEIFPILLKSAYLKTELNHKNELLLQSPRLDHIERLALFLEDKSHQKQSGQLIPHDLPFYKALQSVAGSSEKILKEERIWIHEIEAIIDLKVPLEFIQKIKLAGILVSEKVIEIEKFWVNLETLDEQLDFEKITFQLSPHLK